MAFVNPQILQKIFGGAPAAQPGAFDPSTPQGQTMYQMMAGAGAGMSQAAAQPGADFGQSLGGGAAGMMQGQQQAQQMQMNQMKMAQAQREMERQERLGKIMGDILQGPKQDWASQVDARLPQGPQITPLQQNVSPQASRYAGPPDAQRWEAMFPDLKANVVRQESGGRQFAEGGGPLTSSAGALGKMQVMPGTGPDAAELAGLPWDPERLKNDEAYNEALGTAYLNHLGGRYSGDPVLASAAYNWGMGRVDQHNQNVGDPRKGEISHEEWVQSIPNDEAKNYAATVGMPLLGGGGQQQPQQAPAQPQQPQMNGYQQNVAQQQANDPLAGLPQGTRQMLSLMDPEQAMQTVVDLQTRGPADVPARIQEAQMIAQQTGEPVGTVLARMRDIMGDGDAGPVDQRARKIEEYQRIYGMSENEATATADGLIKPIYNENLGRTVLMDYRDPNNPRVREVPVAPAAPLAEEEVPDKTLWERTYESGTTGLLGGIGEATGRVTGQFNLPVAEEATENRQAITMASRDLVRALQNNPRYAEGERKSIAEEININPSVFDSPSALRARLRAIKDSLERRLANNRRIEGDPSQGEEIRRDASRAALDIQRFLTQLGPTEPLDEEGGGGGGDFAPEDQELINRWAE